MRCRGVLSVIVNLPEMHIPPWYWFRSGPGQGWRETDLTATGADRPEQVEQCRKMAEGAQDCATYPGVMLCSATTEWKALAALQNATAKASSSAERPSPP